MVYTVFCNSRHVVWGARRACCKSCLQQTYRVQGYWNWTVGKQQISPFRSKSRWTCKGWKLWCSCWNHGGKMFENFEKQNGRGTECHKGSASDILKNQCFSLRCGKLCLKKCHSYYYQVQLQLLITEKNFCDLVLHTPKGPPAVERIWPEPQLQEEIVNNTKSLWQKVFVPEYFLMKVPRRLLPQIF